jgi:hypothetical protein
MHRTPLASHSPARTMLLFASALSVRFEKEAEAQALSTRTSPRR